MSQIAEYRIRRVRPWGKDRIYGMGNRPVMWTPDGRLAEVVDSIRPLIEGRWVSYASSEIEVALRQRPEWVEEFSSADDLMAALSIDDRYEIETSPSAPALASEKTSRRGRPRLVSWDDLTADQQRRALRYQTLKGALGKHAAALQSARTNDPYIDYRTLDRWVDIPGRQLEK